ncbi:MAG TPA: YtxH domain-containing protein [Flavobacterium sp.]|uniref:YtxH domain-containing protein n=1 Tax=Flavobacterium sp. TaxID=239 RepID=UPI002CE33D1F|nr:YtxH domain-containing protein [Flavobacterium sp.]HSD13279.1 YtxH domain-containing protein [Flavobacterium sp.]
MNKIMGTGKVVLGILGGLAAGALLGILFAPEKGSKTRKKILEKGQKYADDVKDKLDEVYKNSANKFNNLLSDAKDMVSKKEVSGSNLNK